MSAYCTVADLRLAQGDELLAQLVDDALEEVNLGHGDPDFWTDGGVAALLSQAIISGSASVDDYIAGRMDMTDATVQAALNRYSVALALEWLWVRAGHEPSRNPWIVQANSARARLKEMRSGQLSAGDTARPLLTTLSTTDGVIPLYLRDPDDPERMSKQEADW